MRVSRASVATEIATRARAARAQRRWALDEPAVRSTVSRRLLVQIQHGDANSSLAILLKHAAALGITPTKLVSEETEAESAGVVAGPDAMTLWSTPGGSAARLLVSPRNDRAVVMDARARRSTRQRSHRPGSVELVAVDTGTFALDVGHHQVEVPAGDSTGFDATLAPRLLQPRNDHRELHPRRLRVGVTAVAFSPNCAVAVA